MLTVHKAPKKATNLSLNAAVLKTAKDLGMNISQTVDELLAKEVNRLYWEQWNERNKDAIAANNERIRRDGIWGAKYRTFAREPGDDQDMATDPTSA